MWSLFNLLVESINFTLPTNRVTLSIFTILARAGLWWEKARDMPNFWVIIRIRIGRTCYARLFLSQIFFSVSNSFSYLTLINVLDCTTTIWLKINLIYHRHLIVVASFKRWGLIPAEIYLYVFIVVDSFFSGYKLLFCLLIF